MFILHCSSAHFRLVPASTDTVAAYVDGTIVLLLGVACCVVPVALWHLVADVHVAAHGQAVSVAAAPQTEGLCSLIELRLLHTKHPDVEQLVQERCTQRTQTQQSWIVVTSE